MTAPPKVIKAVFYTWRPVVGHKRLQLVFEVPLEETQEVLTMLGAPMPDREIWCAIALLAPVAPLDATKERRSFCDLPLPQQAGIKSEDLTFQLWISSTPIGKEAEDCASAIRAYCGVESRAQILPGTKAAARWIDLLRSFEERSARQ